MVEETLLGLRITKVLNAEQQISYCFTSANEYRRRTIAQVYARQGLAHPMSEFLGTTVIAIIFRYGGNLIFAGSSSITVDVSIYHLVIFYSIINPVKELSCVSYSI